MSFFSLCKLFLLVFLFLFLFINQRTTASQCILSKSCTNQYAIECDCKRTELYCTIFSRPLSNAQECESLSSFDFAHQSESTRGLYAVQQLTMMTYLSDNKNGSNEESGNKLIKLHLTQSSQDQRLQFPSQYWKVFERALNLKQIELHALQIANFDQPFARLLTLESLKIHQLRTPTNLIDGLFAQLSQLKELELGHNHLNALPEQLFAQLFRLQILHLESNLLESLPPKLFADTKSLKFLSLKDNRLLQLHKETFIQLHRLEQLDLSSNRLFELHETIFNRLHNLTELRLSFNRLRFLPKKIFSSLVNLEQLHLDHNQLGWFDVQLPPPSSSFQHRSVVPLQVLRLNDNQFKNFQQSHFMSWLDILYEHKRSKFYFNDNPIRCACELAWLDKYLHGNKPFLKMNCILKNVTESIDPIINFVTNLTVKPATFHTISIQQLLKNDSTIEFGQCRSQPKKMTSVFDLVTESIDEFNFLSNEPMIEINQLPNHCNLQFANFFLIALTTFLIFKFHA